MSLTWVILLCAFAFLVGCLVTDFENNKIEKAFYKNLRELKEIHQKIDERDQSGRKKI